MNRREFCRTALNLGLFSVASSLLPFRTFAQIAPNGKPQFFILLHIFGGWDTSLATEAWTSEKRPDEKDYFIEYRHDEIVPFNSTSFVGPALLPMKNYFDRMTIFNGIFMSANDGGHDSATLYASSGNGQGNLGLLPLELEGKLFNSPFGTLSDRSPYAAGKSKVVWDMSDLLGSSSELGGPDLLIDFDEARTDLSQARKAIIANANRSAIFNSVLKQFPERTNASIIASAFRSGLSSSVAIDNVGKFMDTHSNHPKTHLNDLTTNFAEIAKLLDVLKSQPGVDASANVIESTTLLDQTTVMVISEFTRTPALNGSNGKDHNPQANSAIVISPQIKSGIFGASTVVTRAQSKSGVPYLAGLPWDLTTHEVSYNRKNSFILRPENVVATVVKSLGVDPISISKGLGNAQLLTKVPK